MDNDDNGKPLRVGLIGARGYTGRELINLVNIHPRFELTYVSSRELDGKPVPGYTKASLDHVNLSPKNVGKIAKSGRQEVDIWVLALPNGAAAPFVEELDRATGSLSSDNQSIVIDTPLWRLPIRYYRCLDIRSP